MPAATPATTSTFEVSRIKAYAEEPRIATRDNAAVRSKRGAVQPASQLAEYIFLSIQASYQRLNLVNETSKYRLPKARRYILPSEAAALSKTRTNHGYVFWRAFDSYQRS